MKECRDCKAVLPETDFYIKRKPDKYDCLCKPCRRAKNKILKEKNGHTYKKVQRRPPTQKKKKIKTPEQIDNEKKKDSARRKKRRQILIDEYIENHGGPPKCNCGCGQDANFDSYGKPNRYSFGHHGKISSEKLAEARWGQRIPSDKFRSAIKTILGKRGWTLRELAENAEVDYAALRRSYYGTAKTVSKPWVAQMLRNLADVPKVPTEEERQAMEESMRRERHFEASINATLASRSRRLDTIRGN